MIAKMVEVGGYGIRAMRDATRGGVAAVCNEFASSSSLSMRLFESTLPIHKPVQSACEMLGLDPLYVANEGKLIVVCAPEIADDLLISMQSDKLGTEAAIIGEIIAKQAVPVVCQNNFGIDRVVDMPVGEQLPRIC
jgi:hydrogenase expression/formation protein HypE